MKTNEQSDTVMTFAEFPLKSIHTVNLLISPVSPLDQHRNVHIEECLIILDMEMSLEQGLHSHGLRMFLSAQKVDRLVNAAHYSGRIRISQTG
jgi:hypothetical protein